LVAAAAVAKSSAVDPEPYRKLVVLVAGGAYDIEI
jgi:hypothetical protein